MVDRTSAGVSTRSMGKSCTWGRAWGCIDRSGETLMDVTKSKLPMETKLRRISDLSASNPKLKFKWLMSHFCKENLVRCFHELDGKKAVGIDRMTKEEYGRNLEANIEDLIVRMKSMAYRPQPAREVLIPKDNGKMRPLGIACIEDKTVQLMFAKVLEAIYEPSFLDCSFGFRPKRNCHQMIAGVHGYLFGQWRPVVIDVDLENFFGTIDHAKLLKLLRMRIEDETFLRYIARMLKSGVLSGDSLRISEDGTPQGSVCSPVLANIFAHYAVDVWVEDTVRKHCPSAKLFRYCDDLVICCANLLEANRVMAALPKRLERFSLKLNQAKSKLVVMDKAAAGRGNRQGTFDLLGFTFYLGRNRKGTYVPKLQTSRKRFRRKLREINQWVRIHRHQVRMPDLWRQLQVKIRGHIEYYGVSHNAIFLSRFSLRARMIFFKWMNRRSQKRSVTWEQFTMFMKRHPEAKVSISHRLF